MLKAMSFHFLASITSPLTSHHHTCNMSNPEPEEEYSEAEGEFVVKEVEVEDNESRANTKAIISSIRGKGKQESQVSNDVIEETASKLLEERKNKGELQCLFLLFISFFKQNKLEASSFKETIKFYELSLFIHARVSPLDGSKEWFLTTMYASPRPPTREELWVHLSNIAAITSEAWVVIGDLNSYLLPEEKYGGAPPNERLMQWFRLALNQCGLMDLGFIGPHFTWEWRGVKERLDRAVANASWQLSFPNTTLSHMPSFCSDHNAILLDNLPTTRPQKSMQWIGIKMFLEIFSKRNVGHYPD
ncbi:Endonuclease/exonuclease/phosphatase superfamily [Sesbania bispinosa]|nr:Endonuclease/exonuclease/phosphatase superfamily [Sesbania bispinosa]